MKKINESCGGRNVVQITVYNVYFIQYHSFFFPFFFLPVLLKGFSNSGVEIKFHMHCLFVCLFTGLFACCCLSFFKEEHISRSLDYGFIVSSPEEEELASENNETLCDPLCEKHK